MASFPPAYSALMTFAGTNQQHVSAQQPMNRPQQQPTNGTGAPSQQQPQAAAARAPTAAAAAADESEQQIKWTSTFIPLPIVDEEQTAVQGEEVLVEINFAEMIGSGSRTAKNNVSRRKYLSSKYNYNSANFRKNQLAPLFQKACARGGFDVVMKGWEEHREMIRFACQRSRVYKSRAKSENADGDDTNNRKPEPRKISRPLTHACPFNFSVHWEPAANASRIGRWYVCASGMGKCNHEGHAHKPWQEDQLNLAKHDVAFQQFMPQYQQFCLLAASGDLYQMDYAGRLMQESIYKLQAKVPPQKRKRGRKPNAEKHVQFASLEGVSLPYASKPPSSMPEPPRKKPSVAKEAKK